MATLLRCLLSLRHSQLTRTRPSQWCWHQSSAANAWYLVRVLVEPRHARRRSRAPAVPASCASWSGKAPTDAALIDDILTLASVAGGGTGDHGLGALLGDDTESVTARAYAPVVEQDNTTLLESIKVRTRGGSGCARCGAYAYRGGLCRVSRTACAPTQSEGPLRSTHGGTDATQTANRLRRTEGRLDTCHRDTCRLDGQLATDRYGHVLAHQPHREGTR